MRYIIEVDDDPESIRQLMRMAGHSIKGTVWLTNFDDTIAVPVTRIEVAS